MAKILLVEDDKSLREIYGVRLMAEGYEIVSAGDGEEALAMAIKERPDLIVSDVMMPKISGFDMLDILRSTSETKDVKVIMMTALSSDDQRARGEALGADRYLVKSQVGIEDVVRTVHDVLGDSLAPAPAAPSFPPAATPVAATPAPAEPLPAQPTEAPLDPQLAAALAAVPEPAPAPVAEPMVAPAPVEVAPAPAPVAIPEPTPAPVAPIPVEPLPTPPAPAAPVFEATPVAPAPQPMPAPVATDAYAAPVEVAPAPVPESMVAPAPVEMAPAPAPVAPVEPLPVAPVAPAPAPTSATLTELPAAPAPLPQPTAPFSSPAPASLGERVIQPLTNPEVAPATNDIASQMEQALNTQTPPAGMPPVPPAA